MARSTCLIYSEDGALRKLVDIQSHIRSERAMLVAITGIDGCGKGHVAARWRDRLQGHGLRVALVGIDGWLNLPAKRFGGTDPAGHFYSHALRFDEMFPQLVLPLQAQRSIRLEADFTAETANAYRKETYEFHDVDVILLEGIYLLKRMFRTVYDASFWIECTFDTALERAIERGQEGLTPAQTTHAYRTIYFPAQEIHFRQDDPKNSATGIVINDPRLLEI